MRIEPYARGHLGRLQPGKFDKPSVDLALAREDELAGNAFTVLHGDEVLAVVGVNDHGDTCYLWFIGSDEIRGHPFALHRGAIRFLRALKAEMAKPVETQVSQKFTLGVEWLRRLGFDFVRWEQPGNLRYRL